MGRTFVDQHEVPEIRHHMLPTPYIPAENEICRTFFERHDDGVQQSNTFWPPAGECAGVDAIHAVVNLSSSLLSSGLLYFICLVDKSIASQKLPCQPG